MLPYLENFGMQIIVLVNISVLLLKLTSDNQSLPHRCPVHRPTCLSMLGACVTLCVVKHARERNWYYFHHWGYFEVDRCVPGALSWSVGLFHLETMSLVFHNLASVCIK